MNDIYNLSELLVEKGRGAEANLLDNLMKQLTLKEVLDEGLLDWTRRLSATETIDGECCIACIIGKLGPVVVCRANAEQVYKVRFLR